MLALGVLTAGLQMTAPIASAQDTDTIQLGPRPFFLVDRLDEGPLKEKLASCKTGPFKRTTFSIGHRGQSGTRPGIDTEGVRMSRKIRFPSPALVVAMIALFVALGGTAVAASVVPLAKRALLADNAKKLGGKTAAEIASLPGPATSASGLVTFKTAPFSLGGRAGSEVIVACDAGQKAISGGFDSNGSVVSFDARPMGDGAAWALYLVNLSDGQGASGTAYAVCLR
jgi:hypothetical protein